MILNKKSLNWKDIQFELKRRIFLKNILEWKFNQIDDKILFDLQNNYLNSKHWNVDIFSKQQEALALFAEWIEAIVKCFEIIKKQKNMENEMIELS